MPVEVQELETQIDVTRTEPSTPGGAPTSSVGTGTARQSQEELVELLRPVVLRILDEELDRYLRMKG